MSWRASAAVSCGGVMKRAKSWNPSGMVCCTYSSSPTTAYVEDPLTPEPAEHAPEIFDAQRVQLVEPGEGPGVAPPDAGDPLHQALVLLGLGKAAEAGELVGHGDEIYGVGEVGGGWGG